MRPLLSTATISLSLLSATLVSSTLNIHNWCNTSLTLWLSNNGGCDHGPSGICSSAPNSIPYLIPQNATLPLPWLANSRGTSVKILKNATNVRHGTLQYEYNRGSGNMWWDLSDLDGDGASVTGSPFRAQNVVVTPVEGAVVGDVVGGREGWKKRGALGTGTCVPLVCPRGVVCEGSYQRPDDVATRWCPMSVETFWIDLCVPDELLRKRGMSLKG